MSLVPKLLAKGQIGIFTYTDIQLYIDEYINVMLVSEFKKFSKGLMLL